MIERITDNEERLDKLLESIKTLQKDLDNFKLLHNDLVLINQYYGSKKWFKDKEKYEKGIIKNIKAGVLSEDTVWNMNDDINDLINDMEDIIKLYKERKNEE